MVVVVVVVVVMVVAGDSDRENASDFLLAPTSVVSGSQFTLVKIRAPSRLRVV